MTPPSVTDESSAEIRNRIVAAAQARFMAHGFSTVTMDDIARELGMSKKTLYEFFPGKKELLRATTRCNSDSCERELNAIAAEKLDFFERARKTFAHIARIYARLTPGYMTDLRRSAPEVWAEIQEFRRTRVRKHMLDLLDQGVAQGVLRKDLDRETLVRLYLTMTSALLNPEVSGWEPGEQIAPIFETFVRVYFEGLITDAGRRALAGKK
ncbi:MAG TPA: TetR/AcrR family transcriptional regulator [Elusimicrobiota bacterium]|nr:TetR/AcrR family transcriptional regulator [Elusimicrobiota bacterium]